jgi:hypothetical protein
MFVQPAVRLEPMPMSEAFVREPALKKNALLVKEGDVCVPHTVGEAVLHLGCLDHATLPITKGQRVNLICFFAVEWVPFQFVQLPKDLQRMLASYLPARDVMALSATCCAVRSVLETHDALWERLFEEHPLHKSLKEEALQLRRNASAKRVYVGVLELATIQGLSRTLSANAPHMMVKETYEMGIQRSAEEARESEVTVCQLGLHQDLEVLTRVRDC